MNLEVGPGYTPKPEYVTVDRLRWLHPTIIADASYLPIKTGSISKFYSSRCLEHTVDFALTMSEVKRVTRGEVVLVFGSWRSCLYYHARRLLNPLWRYSTRRHPRFPLFTKGRVRRLLLRYFRVVHVSAVHPRRFSVNYRAYMDNEGGT